MITIIVLGILACVAVVAVVGLASLHRDLDNEATRRDRARAASER